MHITLSASSLITILAVIVVLAIIFRLVNMRYRGPGRRSRGTGAPPRERRSSGRKRSSRGPSYSARDHGLAVAQRYGREARSPEWPALAHAHLAKEPACRVCGHTGKGLAVHHIKPFHLYPELELDPNNLITLCEIKGRDHHLLIGHLDDWESYNPQVRTDVNKYHNENAATIRSNPSWLQEERNRPQPQLR